MTRAVQPPRDPFGWTGVVIDGRYRVGDAVGEGGFGVVYAGKRLDTDEPIAVKFLKLDGAVSFAQRGRFLSRFVGEGKLLSHLGELTPGVVRAIDVGAATAPSGVWTPYLVLEWLDGVTLEEELAARLERGLGGRTLREAIELLEPAARAVDVAHEHGAVHRDIKPANLVVTEVGGRRTLKILDFGVATVMRELRERAEAVSAGAPRHAFWPPYGAPEQFEQRYGATGPWTDVFALALVLVELVAGRRALSGDDVDELYRQAADTARRPTLRTLGVESSDEVERVLQQALEVEPRRRHRRAGDFWDALVAATRAAPPPPVDASAAPAEAAGTPGAAPEEAADDVEEITDSELISPSEAPVARLVPPVDQGGGDARRAPRVAGAIAIMAFAAAIIAGTRSRSTTPAASTSPGAGGAPTATSTGPIDAVATATIATPSPPAVSPTPASTPRVRPASPPRDPQCPNCAAHPRQCGKFSMPQVRGDCYCGCGAGSHCALPPGRSTGPCVPNSGGVSEAL